MSLNDYYLQQQSAMGNALGNSLCGLQGLGSLPTQQHHLMGGRGAYTYDTLTGDFEVYIKKIDAMMSEDASHI